MVLFASFVRAEVAPEDLHFLATVQVPKQKAHRRKDNGPHSSISSWKTLTGKAQVRAGRRRQGSSGQHPDSERGRTHVEGLKNPKQIRSDFF